MPHRTLAPLTALLSLAAVQPSTAAESSAVLAYDGKWATEGSVTPLTVELTLAPVDAAEALARPLPSLPETARTRELEVVDAAPAGAPDAPPVPGPKALGDEERTRESVSELLRRCPDGERIEEARRLLDP